MNKILLLILLILILITQIKFIKQQKTTEPFIFENAFKSVKKAVSGPINAIKNLAIKVGNVFTSIGSVYGAMIQLMIRLFKLKAKLDKFAKRFENCNAFNKKLVVRQFLKKINDIQNKFTKITEDYRYCMNLSNFNKPDYTKRCVNDLLKDMVSLSGDSYTMSIEMLKVFDLAIKSPELFPQPKGKNANNRYGKSIEECNAIYKQLSKIKNLSDDQWNDTYVNQCRQCFNLRSAMNYRINDIKVIIKESFEIMNKLMAVMKAFN